MVVTAEKCFCLGAPCSLTASVTCVPATTLTMKSTLTSQEIKYWILMGIIMLASDIYTCRRLPYLSLLNLGGVVAWNFASLLPHDNLSLISMGNHE